MFSSFFKKVENDLKINGKKYKRWWTKTKKTIDYNNENAPNQPLYSPDLDVVKEIQMKHIKDTL